jgi:hypothetical protein
VIKPDSEPIMVRCPDCGRTGRVPGRLAARAVSCKHCKTRCEVVEPRWSRLSEVHQEPTAPSPEEQDEEPGFWADPPRGVWRGLKAVARAGLAVVRTAVRPFGMIRSWRGLLVLTGAGTVLALVVVLIVIGTRKAGNKDSAPGPVTAVPGLPGFVQLPEKPKEPDVVSLSKKEKEAAAEAVKALSRVDAAVEVGIQYQQYLQRIGDAKAAVNEAQVTLPDCELRTELEAAMDAYKDVADVWSDKIRDLYRFDDVLRKKLAARYHSLKSEDSAEVAMQFIWFRAAKHIEVARTLSNSGSGRKPPVPGAETSKRGDM